jgi:hypothetical protein
MSKELLGPLVSRLQDLLDLSTAFATTGQVPVWNNTTKLFEPTAITGGASTGTGFPTATPAAGSFYFDTASGLPYGYDGTSWFRLAGGLRHKAGYYYQTTNAASGGYAVTFGNNTLRTSPVTITGVVNVTEIGVQIQTAGNAGSTIRMGIYADNGGRPGALIVDGGTVPGDAVSTFAKVTINVTLVQGTYWFAAVCQNSATLIPSCLSSLASTMDLGTPTGNVTSGSAAIVAAGVTGALPNPFPNGGLDYGSSGPPRMVFKAS